MKNSVGYLQILFIILLIGYSRQDIPVHCLKSQVAGTWNLQYTSARVKGNEYNQCGHAQPDNQNSSNQAFLKEFQAAASIQLDLGTDYQVRDSSKSELGDWTMVYDQGFQINTDEFSFFAFSKYEKQGNRYNSHCDETLIGWYHNQLSEEKGCYRATKQNKVEATQSIEQVSVLQPQSTQTKEEKSPKFLQMKEEQFDQQNNNQQLEIHSEQNQNDSQSVYIQEDSQSIPEVQTNSDTNEIQFDIDNIDNDKIESIDENTQQDFEIVDYSETIDKNISPQEQEKLREFELVMLQPDQAAIPSIQKDVQLNLNTQQFGEEPLTAYLREEQQFQDIQMERTSESQEISILFNEKESDVNLDKHSLGFEDENSSYLETKSQNQENTKQKSFKKREDSNQQDVLEMHNEFNEHHKVVKRLNQIEGQQWEAATNDNFSQMNMKEINKIAGRKKQFDQPFHDTFQTVPGFKQQDFPSQVKYSKGYDEQYINYSREDVSDLPKQHSDQQFLRKPLQQRDCGSCYAIATMEMLQARLKKLYGENVNLSVQHALDCNYYNQGCDGGYPFLVEKFASQNDLVPQSCSPYLGIDGQCDKCNVQNLAQTYRVSKYGFIGGAYGQSSEREIMKEILNNGPVVLSFEPAYDFIYYQSGVYHSVDAEDWILQGQRMPEWEKVDHSVLCYGWGETQDGQKYWNLLNSWGQDWGENGHFRMRRGTDESHIESMGEAAIPVIIDKLKEKYENHQEKSFLGLEQQTENSKNQF